MSDDEMYLIGVGLATGLAQQARQGYRLQRARFVYRRVPLNPVQRLELVASSLEWLRVAAASKLAMLV